MTQQEYEKQKRECWEKVKFAFRAPNTYRKTFDFIFDRAYALGKANCAEAEAEEKTLSVSRKRVQEIYSYNEKILSQDPAHSGAILLKKKLTDLFGSKCLADGNEDNFAKSEPQPAEPKFTKGDMVHCIYFGYAGDYRVLEYSGGCYDCIDKYGAHYRFYESDLEPYTEPTETCTDDCQCPSQDCDRLHIAAQILAGFYANETYAREFYMDKLVKLSLEVADALIAECGKGGSDGED